MHIYILYILLFVTLSTNMRSFNKMSLISSLRIVFWRDIHIAFIAPTPSSLIYFVFPVSAQVSSIPHKNPTNVI